MDLPMEIARRRGKPSMTFKQRPVTMRLRGGIKRQMLQLTQQSRRSINFETETRRSQKTTTQRQRQPANSAPPRFALMPVSIATLERM